MQLQATVGYKATRVNVKAITLRYYQSKDNGCRQDQKKSLIISGFWWRRQNAEGSSLTFHKYSTINKKFNCRRLRRLRRFPVKRSRRFTEEHATSCWLSVGVIRVMQLFSTQLQFNMDGPWDVYCILPELEHQDWVRVRISMTIMYFICCSEWH